MPVAIRVKVEGFGELDGRLKAAKVLGKPTRRYLKRMGNIMKKAVMERTPVDRGNARASYDVKIDKRVVPKWVRVTNRVRYIGDLHYGTQPHRPRITKRLQGWASRHGFSRKGLEGAYQVASIIEKKGTKPRDMFNTKKWSSKHVSAITKLRTQMEKEIAAGIKGRG